MELIKTDGVINVYQHADQLCVKGVDLRDAMGYSTYCSTFFDINQANCGLEEPRDYIITEEKTTTNRWEDIYFYTLCGAKKIYYYKGTQAFKKKELNPDLFSFLNSPFDFVSTPVAKVEQIALQLEPEASQEESKPANREMTVTEFANALQDVLRANSHQAKVIDDLVKRIDSADKLVKKHANIIDRMQVVIELQHDKVNTLEESLEELENKYDFLLEIKTVPRDIDVYKKSSYAVAESMGFYSESSSIPHVMFINAIAKHLGMIDGSLNLQVTEWAYKEAHEKGAGSVYYTDTAISKIQDYLNDNFMVVFDVSLYKVKKNEGKVKDFVAKIGNSRYRFDINKSADIIKHYQKKMAAVQPKEAASS
jgi:hypothetical protein